jgi:hypothetical protein
MLSQQGSPVAPHVVHEPATQPQVGDITQRYGLTVPLFMQHPPSRHNVGEQHGSPGCPHCDVQL